MQFLAGQADAKLLRFLLDLTLCSVVFAAVLRRVGSS
jgi:hypothetical protein